MPCDGKNKSCQQRRELLHQLKCLITTMERKKPCEWDEEPCGQRGGCPQKVVCSKPKSSSATYKPIGCQPSPPCKQPCGPSCDPVLFCMPECPPKCLPPCGSRSGEPLVLCHPACSPSVPQPKCCEVVCKPQCDPCCLKPKCSQPCPPLCPLRCPPACVKPCLLACKLVCSSGIGPAPCPRPCPPPPCSKPKCPPPCTSSRMCFSVCAPEPKVVCCNPVKRCKSFELRSSLMHKCICPQRNGLQDRCLMSDCMGYPECMTKLFPICDPGQWALMKLCYMGGS